MLFLIGNLCEIPSTDVPDSWQSIVERQHPPWHHHLISRSIFDSAHLGFESLNQFSSMNQTFVLCNVMYEITAILRILHQLLVVAVWLYLDCVRARPWCL